VSSFYPPVVSSFGPQPGQPFSFTPEKKAPSTHIQVPPWMQTPDQVDNNRFAIPSVTSQTRPDMSVPVVSSQVSQPGLSSAPQGTQSSTTKLLLLIALTFKQGRISNEEKGRLKDLTLRKDGLVLAALEVFEIDQDLEEFVDTVKRICKLDI